MASTPVELMPRVWNRSAATLRIFSRKTDT
jgi:hypothetical protein